MSLLGQGFEDPRSAAVMALAGGLLRGDFGGGLLGANQAFAQSQEGALKRQLAQAQLEESQAQTMQRRALAQKESEALARAQRQQSALPGLFRQPGMTGGQAVPQEMGGVPMFSKPMQAAPMQATPGGFDVQGAIAAGFTPEQITAYSNLQNLGRPEVARTVDIAGPRGEKLTQAYDKFGQPIGQPMNAFEAAQFLNLGDRQVAAVPRAGMSLPVGMSPSEKDASQRGWAGVKVQQDRLKFDKEDPKLAWNSDLGGFVNPRTREVLPAMRDGKPAQLGGIKLNEPQAKANLFGTRMQEANRILTEMETAGVNNSGLIKNAVQGTVGLTPFLGDKLSDAAGSVMTALPGVLGGPSDEQQQVEQAQRDFTNAVLRRESGAAIAPSEFANAKRQYFPQPGEGKAVIEQKRRARELAIKGLQVEVPGGTFITPPESPQKPAQPPTAPPAAVTPSLRWDPKTRTLVPV